MIITFIITKLNVKDLKVDILSLKKTREASLSFIFDNMDNTNVYKLYENRIEVYKINAGLIYNNKTLIYIYQINEHRENKHKQSVLDEIKLKKKG